MTDWGYSQANGPSEWGKAFPIAVTGTRQSPIDIKPDACKICNKPSDEKLIISYPSSISGCTIKNSGYGWTVNIANALDTNANVTGNPLKNETYVLEQFHAHWGCNDTCGSEHTIAGKAFSAELHLVHWNKDRFASFAEAAKNDHGLAVVAIFLESTDDTNEINKNSTLNNLCEKLTDVPFKGDSVDFKADVKLSDLLPNDHSFWTYDGSLTTPPLYESVTWLVLKQPIKIPSKHLQVFRKLHCGPAGSECVHQNFRPPQPIFQRTVQFVPA